MSAPLGTVSAAGPRWLLEVASAAGVDSNRLAQSAGLDSRRLSDPAGRVETAAVMSLLNNSANTMNDPLFGMHLGRDYLPGRLGLYDYLFLTANTLENAFDTAIRYSAVAAAYGAYEWVDAADRTAVRRTLPNGPDYHHAEAFVVSWQLTMARHATGRSLREVRIGFAQPAPKHARALIEALGVSRVEFGCSATTITLASADVELPLLSADPMLAAVLRRHADGRRPAPESWPDRVRAFLADGFTDRTVTLDTAARAMSISPRMLQQHLHDMGTSWRIEVESARDDLAVDLLRNSSLSVTVIAHRLGYSDARAFRRAFRRQSNLSPDQYRRQKFA